MKTNNLSALSFFLKRLFVYFSRHNLFFYLQDFYLTAAYKPTIPFPGDKRMRAKLAHSAVIVLSLVFVSPILKVHASDPIYDAMMRSRLTPAEITTHAANRLGYGISSVPGSNAVNAESDRTGNFLRRLAADINTEISGPYPLGYPESLKPYFQLLSPVVDGNSIDPTLTSDELLEIFYRYALIPSPSEEVIRIYSSIISYTKHQSSQMKVLRAALGSQYEDSRGNYVDRQINLREVLQEFWFNHFNVNVAKAGLAMAGTDSYEPVIHKKMYTTFYELLSSVVKHPAMILYLDNQANRIVFSEGKYIATNQNLGRELLELHTLGVGPVAESTPLRYSQKDVEDTSKILAGHNFNRYKYEWRSNNAYKNQYRVGTQTINTPIPTIMKRSFPAEGEERLASFLKFLANHSQTKNNICKKLTETFVVKNAIVSQPVVQRCIESWGTDGNLKGMYKAIVSSNEFWSRANVGNKYRNPLELTIAQVRQNGLSIAHLAQRPIKTSGKYNDSAIVTTANMLIESVKRLGIHLRFFSEPTGYEADGEKWLSKGYLVSLGQTSFQNTHILDIVDTDWGLLQNDLPYEVKLRRTLSQDLFYSDFFGVQLIYRNSGQLFPFLSSNEKENMTCFLSSSSGPGLDCEERSSKLNSRSIAGKLVPTLEKTSKDLSTSTKHILLK